MNPKIITIASRLEKRGIKLPLEYVAALRRQERRLHRWAEKECGDSNDCQSSSIVRDEESGLPYMEIIPHRGEYKPRRYPIRDDERGALRRIEKICKEARLFFYHQTDPRGCALYLATEPLTDQNYTNGVAVCD